MVSGSERFWPGWSRPFVNFSCRRSTAEVHVPGKDEAVRLICAGGTIFAPLAQLVEATDLESVRWRFESVVEHHFGTKLGTPNESFLRFKQRRA